jgi:hypothetical protein
VPAIKIGGPSAATRIGGPEAAAGARRQVLSTTPTRALQAGDFTPS